MAFHKEVFGKDIDPENDIFLGEKRVQIQDRSGNPSVHLVRSYQTKPDPNDKRPGFYHIFFQKGEGRSAVNYNKPEYDQVKKFIDISDHWSIFYINESLGLKIPVSKEWRT